MKVSYKQLPPNLIKEDFGKYATTNHRTIETSFDKLSDYLQHNGNIIPNIALKNGYRYKYNVILPATIELLPLDIDHAKITIDTIHEMLMEEFDLNHILVATSNPTNPLKYRLFIQIQPTEIKSEDEYKQLFDFLPDFLKSEIDLACRNIDRNFYIYGNSAYTIKEYFKGNPLEIKENEIDRTISSSMCSPSLSEAKRHSSNGKLTNYTLKRSELSNTLKTRRYLYAKDKSWYAYEVIHSHPKLLDEANIYKLLKQLSKQHQDKIRLSDTEKRKFSIRPDEKVCSSGFFFSNDCILFKDLGRTDEFAYDIIDFCAKLIHGKIDKSSRDDISERLIKFFNLPKINPYCLE